jgi:hypothetical protein
MKILLVLLSISIGYFLPISNFPINNFLIVGTVILAFILGTALPTMINSGSLLNKEKLEKVKLKNKLSFHSSYTQSLWVGISVCVVAIISFLKNALIFHELNQLSIFIFVFGIGTIIKVYDFESYLDKSE